MMITLFAMMAAQDGEFLPTPYTAEQIRDATWVGRRYRFRIESQGSPVVLSEFMFLSVSEEGCRFRHQNFDEGGTALEYPIEVDAVWSELRDHARFPAEGNSVTKGETTTPAGTYSVRIYEIREGGVTSRYHFAVDLPGPPVHMESEVDGRITYRMDVIEYDAGS